MAKINAPLFSLNSSGSLNKSITFRKKSKNQIASKYSKPGDKIPFESSPRQKDQRSIIRLITIHWQCMSSADKLTWENAAKDVRFKGTGYHYFLHTAQQDLTQYLGLVGYWTMNYNVNNKIPDLSGNSNDCILSPNYPIDSPILVDSFDKKQGKAVLFNGTTNYITTNNASILGLPEFTVEVLFKPLDFINRHTLVCKGLTNLLRNYYLFTDISGNFVFGWANALGNFDLCPYSPIKATLNKYNHMAGSYDGTTFKLYVQGKYATQKISSKSAEVLSPLFIGRASWYSGVFDHGVTDDVSIFSYALSDIEIYKHYQSYNL